MNPFVEFILKHGYSFLFAAMFAHQIGLPIPGPLLLLAAGALVTSGKLNLFDSLFLSVAACVVADWIWFEAGRRRGDRVLHFIHRLASDPDAADARARKHFAKYGPAILVIAKFVPGLDAVAPPMAGTSRTDRSRFLALDAIGASLYCSIYTALGCVFSHDLNRAAAYTVRAGRFIGSIAFATLMLHAGRKFLRAHRAMGASQSIAVTGADEPTAL
jgi:membrane protein DedA with SNARE-associated domain